MRWPRRPALALFACAALSSGDAVLAPGPAASGVTAVADSAIDGASNPAGLTRIQHAEWDGKVVGIQTESTDDSSTSGGRSQSVDNSSTLGIPAVYYAQRWSDRLGLGVSLSVPAGIGSNPGDATIGRYLLEKWSLGYASLAPAIGYRVSGFPSDSRSTSTTPPTSTSPPYSTVRAAGRRNEALRKRLWRRLPGRGAL